MLDASRARDVRIWDLPVRLFHWTLVALVAVLVGTGLAGKLAVHETLGSAVLTLLVFRFGWGLIGSRTARFTDFLRGPRTVLDTLRGGIWPGLGHNPLGGWSVAALLAVLSVQAGTGLFASDDILTEGPLAHLVSAKAVKLLSTVHRVGFKVTLGLVALHLGAVAFHLLVKKENLVRPMISGLRRLPPAIAARADLLEFRSPWLAAGLLALAAAGVFGGLAAWGL